MTGENIKKRVLSCIQPTGEIHLGNYFGAIKNWVEIQDKYNCFYGIVDLHAMTMPYDPKKLKENTLNMAIDLMACGIDINKSVLFIQSLVPEHTMLQWIFSCVTSYGELTRMTQFKDKSELLESQGGKIFISAGLFTYPILQAADILIYHANYVPVGKDQIQHIELTRNIAVRFNHTFGEYFPEPEPLLTSTPKIMSLADPEKKMSKSLGEKHYIGLFEDENSIRKKIRSAVTDVGPQIKGQMSPGVENLFAILKACDKVNEYNSLINMYNQGTLKYKELKDVVSDAVVELTNKFKAKRADLLRDKECLLKLIKEQSEKARNYAKKTLEEVKKLTGISEF